MKRLGLALATTMLLPLVAAAAPGAARPGAVPAAHAPLRVVDIPFQQFVLPNGLTLIVNEDHHQPVAAVSMWYHVGSKNETVGHTGFAHLFEHLMFSGSEHANSSWFNYMNPIGATSLNGTTAQDRTNFFETVPVGALDRLLWLESDRMGHLLGAVDQHRLDEQRGVVENEKRQRSNSPFGEIPQIIDTAAYPPGHPYSWQAIGSIQDLDAASLDDVRNWFRTWYGAGNVVMVISGDVNAAEMHQKVEKYFGFIPRGPALHRNDKWIAKRTGERRDVVQVAAPQGRVYKVWNVPAYGSAERDMLDIAAGILGERINGPLYQRLIVKDHLATDVDADNDAEELGGLFSITGYARPGVDLGVIEKAIDEELARFLRDGPTAEELARFKFSIYADMVRSAEDPVSKGNTLAENFLYTGDAGSYRTSLQRQFQATAEEVRDTARAWLSDGDYVLYAKPSSPPAAATAEVDRSTMPPIGKAPPLALATPRRFTLSDGLKVELVERHSAPTVAMEMIFKTGMAAERGASLPRTGEMATQLAEKGTTTRSEGEIAAEQGRSGFGFDWNESDENMRFTMTALSATLAPALDSYFDVLVNPTFPADVFERDRALAIAGIEQSKSTPGGKIGRTAPALIFGDKHPYAAVPTAATLTALTTGGLRDWYRRWVRPDNATLLIVGDVTESAIRPMLEQRLAGWKAPAAPLPVPAALPPVPVRSGPRIFLIDQPGAQQSVISVNGLAANRGDPDADTMDVANNVIGGAFLSRLNLNLREDKHWSYGAHSSYDPDRFLGTFAVHTSVQTDKTADSLHEIDRELRDILAAREPTPAEIERAKNGDVLTMANDLASAQSTAHLYSEAIRYGLGDDYWNSYVGRIDAITPAQLDAATAKLDHPDALTWVVVSDLSRIEDGVRKLGIGEVHVIDADGKQLR